MQPVNGQFIHEIIKLCQPDWSVQLRLNEPLINGFYAIHVRNMATEEEEL